jgi:hypothetical protein
VHEAKRPARGILRGLLIALGVVMVLTGGLLIIGGIGVTTSRKDNWVAGLIVDLTLGPALVTGGVIVFRRLRPRRAPS